MNNGVIDYGYLVEGLTSERMTRVTNMSRKYISYILPEMNNLRREFAPDESKTLSMGELFALNNASGGSKLIYTSLFIEDVDIKKALELPTGDEGPEFEWTREDAFKVLSEGSTDEILDALEFGPHYIAEWWKTDILKVKNTDRRKYYGDLTGVDVSQAEENLKWAAGDSLSQGYKELLGEDSTVSRQRRRSGKSQEASGEAKSNLRVRRT